MLSSLASSLDQEFGIGGCRLRSEEPFWDQILPTFDVDTDTFERNYQDIKSGNSLLSSWSADTKAKVQRHIVAHREGWMDFVDSATRIADIHKEWVRANGTVLNKAIGIFLCEANTALHMAEKMFAARGCSQWDAQMFVDTILSTINQDFSSAFYAATQSIQTSQPIVDAYQINNVAQLYSEAMLDWDPCSALSDLDDVIFHIRSLHVRRLENWSRSVTWHLNSATYSFLTTERQYLVQQLQSIENFQCMPMP